MALVGDSETALRLPSALFGIANVYALYRLGSLLWDRLTGAFAAILLSFSTLHVWYSQEARMYSLLALTATVFVLSSVRLVLEPSRLRIVLASAAGTLLLYSHVYGAFVWASVNAAVFFRLTPGTRAGRVDRRTWLIPQVIAAATFLPWTVVLAHRVAAPANLSFIPEPTAYVVLYQLWLLASGQAGLVGLCILTLVSLVRLGPGRTRPRISLDCDWRHGLLLTWLIGPALIAYMISTLAYPILLFRYLLCSLPAFHLLAARGLRTTAFNPAAAGVLMLAVVIASFETGLESASAGLKLNDRLAVTREDFRGAAAIFTREFKPSDQVIFMAGETLVPFQYYFRQPLQYRQAWMSAQVPDEVLNGPGRLWIIASHFDGHELRDLVQRASATHSSGMRSQPFGIDMFLFAGAQ